MAAGSNPATLKMRNFNHIILDFESHKSASTSKYWINRSVLNNDTKTPLIYQVDMLNKLSNNDKESLSLKNLYKQVGANGPTSSNINQYPTYFHLRAVNTKDYSNTKYTSYLRSHESPSGVSDFLFEKNLFKTLSLFRDSNSSHFFSANNLVNINFLRKERLYTKLKYSRSPAFDIVSGGSAALLAGFIGFLISEKFGFELVDSGDFYFLFMYGVFACFMLRPLLVTLDYKSSISSILSLKPVVNFYTTVFLFVIRKFKK